MSEKGLNAKVVEAFGSNRRISAFYDFDVNHISALGSDEAWTGVYSNSVYANNSGLHKCFVSSSVDTSTSNVENNLYYITGSNNLSSGYYQIELDDLDIKNSSMILDFQFSGIVEDSVLIGCFETGQEDFAGNIEQISSGFNIGVTDRGHLFCQTLNSRGNSIKVLTNVELSKRNIIGVSLSKSSLTLAAFDYLNHVAKRVEIPVEESFISNVDSIYLGGSNAFYKENPKFNGHVYNFALFSGALDTLLLKEFGEGILGEYNYTAEVEETFYRVTGYEQSVVYKTGITGYDYEVTGTLTIETGRETFTGTNSLHYGTENKQEGDRYYKYYTLNNGNTPTYYKEELGYLNEDSGYVYYPTGEGAYDTLGLLNISESISTYIEDFETGRIGDSIQINLYGKTPKTGVLNEISGVVDVGLSESYSVVTPASSGVSLEGSSFSFKKNYIYYLGDRS